MLLYSTLLAALANAEIVVNPRVYGVEVDWRKPSRDLLGENPLFRKYCEVIQASSVSNNAVSELRKRISEDDKVLVILDSNHTHDHVFEELDLYSDFVTRGSYLVVEDTTIEWHADSGVVRPWGVGNSPMSALNKFLQSDKGNQFLHRKDLTDKLLITGLKDGVIERI